MVPTIPVQVLDQLSCGPRSCIQHLLNHFAATTKPDLSSQPISKLAAVLVLLYEQDGELRVLLTTRSKSLRTHAGQTALPGGKVDESDSDLVATALREAHEEVDLPLGCPELYILGMLDPSISLHRLVVTPVVALFVKPDILKVLKAAPNEVAHIFNHPLEAILDPALARKEQLVATGGDDWPYESQYYNTSDSIVQMLGNTSYRMHRFRTSASPIKGLTADILIKTAEIAFDKSTTYGRYASDQLRKFEDIVQALGKLRSSTLESLTSNGVAN